jgi:hypothetical protein
MTDKPNETKSEKEETQKKSETPPSKNDTSDSTKGQMEFDPKRGTWISRTPYGSFEWSESAQNWIPMVSFFSSCFD